MFLFYVLSLLFGPHRLSEFTLAGPLLSVQRYRRQIHKRHEVVLIAFPCRMLGHLSF